MLFVFFALVFKTAALHPTRDEVVILLAAISTVEPAALAISPLWSGAAVRWGLAVVGTYEWSLRRAEAGLSTSSSNQSKQDPRG